MPTPMTFADAFGDMMELSLAITEAPVQPGFLRSKKIFEESGISTTSAFIEHEHELLDLIMTAPRGGVAQPYSSGGRTGEPVSAVHIPTRGSVMADEVQSVRGFGGNSLESVESLRLKKLTGMKKNIFATIENQQFGIIRGQSLDADGTVLLDVYNLFGITQQVHNLALDVNGTRLLTKIIDAQRLSEDGLGADVPSGYLALTAPDMMDELRNHASYEQALQYARPSDLMADYRGGIEISKTTFVEVRTPAGMPVKIPAGTAYLIPLEIAGLFLTRYAPADFVETVNTVGVPIYAKAEPMPMNKGYFLEAQSNPLHLCTRPRAVIKLTKSA